MKNPFTGMFAGLGVTFKEAAPEQKSMTAIDIMAGASQCAWFTTSDPVDQARFRDVLKSALSAYAPDFVTQPALMSALHQAVTYVQRQNGHNQDAAFMTAKIMSHEIRRKIEAMTLYERHGFASQFLALPNYTDKQLREHAHALDLMSGQS